VPRTDKGLTRTLAWRQVTMPQAMALWARVGSSKRATALFCTSLRADVVRQVAASTKEPILVLEAAKEGLCGLDLCLEVVLGRGA
jgi:hypothetical protein